MTEILNIVLILEWVLFVISFYKRVSLEKKIYDDTE